MNPRRPPENWRRQAAILAFWTFGLLGLGWMAIFLLIGSLDRNPQKSPGPSPTPASFVAPPR